LKRMDSELPKKEFDAICAVVNLGTGSKVLKIAKLHGVTGGTILLGNGTIKNRILEVLDLTDVRKEIVFTVVEKSIGLNALEAINRELRLHKPNHGIAFSISVSGIFGLSHCKCGCVAQRKNEVGSVYKAIFVVVEKGKAENVMDAATKAGARGGTIINARGSGIHETKKIFSMDIEPEKEFILILTESEIADAVISSIRNDLRIDEPGNGIIFIQDVNNAYGLY
jgi:nitrogen regulatory protein PII